MHARIVIKRFLNLFAGVWNQVSRCISCIFDFGTLTLTAGVAVCFMGPTVLEAGRTPSERQGPSIKEVSTQSFRLYFGKKNK